jgi:N-acetylated-alpha-linked acidic dipeptidase
MSLLISDVSVLSLRIYCACRTIPNEARAVQSSKEYSTIPHLAGSDQDFLTAKSFLELLQSELGVSKPLEFPVYDAGSPESQDATFGILTRSEPSAWIDKYYPGGLISTGSWVE